jgi:elongation factor G
MAVEVVTPEESLGTVIGDLNSRRGQVLSLNERGTSKVGALFGDVPGLRGLARGRANATMHFAHYAPVPASVAQQIVNA